MFIFSIHTQAIFSEKASQQKNMIQNLIFKARRTKFSRLQIIETEPRGKRNRQDSSKGSSHDNSEGNTIRASAGLIGWQLSTNSAR
jgi:hypothetical protein